MRRVLVANRGEIAVRVVRACRDSGVESVAVYAEPDQDTPHVRLADSAFALGGNSPAASYLNIEKIIEVAKASGADAVHPGYGFLAENADFAQAVIDAHLTWIGPEPRAIRALGDKVSARRIAQRVGAPLVAATPGPVSGPAEVEAFALEHGLPIVIKAVHGGGGRGLKVVRRLDEIPAHYESAVREATLGFGRGECFAEQYLERTRHVETQCLADSYNDVAVVSTRDCSLQRRHQKLVEEAPAPFLTVEQTAELCAASKAILAETGYIGAATCEFLVADSGAISFLEVNTRLQVEHPVTEEVTDLDLVREQLRLADGQRLGYGDCVPRRHSIEFRINAEDPGRDFCPVPGSVDVFEVPTGPGVRLDSGVSLGNTVSPAWDSMLAKLIVTGADRAQALRRAARALEEFRVDGVPTVLPFHRAVVEDPDFTAEPFRVHTRWIESEFRNSIAPQEQDSAGGEEAVERRRTVVAEVDGRRVEVSFPEGLGGSGRTPAAPTKAVRSPRTRGRPANASGAELASPMQGVVVRVGVEEGQTVEEGEPVAVLEAMKMEHPLRAHKSGTVVGLAAKIGMSVSKESVLCRIEG
jgi:acetyl-CoA/propionyl-CoA carboxylase biotin carboxyl carrier protein